MDIYGDHALCCPSTSARIDRHDKLIDVFAKYLQEGRMKFKKEMPSGFETNNRMGDIVIYEGTQNKNVWMDFSVVSPLAPSYFKKAAKELGSALEDRVYNKERKYENEIEQNNAIFKVIAVDIFGAWHVPALRSLKHYCRVISNSTNSEFRNLFKNLFTDLSTTLQKHQGEMLASRLFTLEP